MTTFVPNIVISQALDTARALAGIGVPIFVAPPCAGEACNPDCRRRTKGKGTDTGFHLPMEWPSIIADPAVVDTWAPGCALCAVMGHRIDLLDVDPRNGGDLAALGADVPRSYGTVLTPSEGLHHYIAALSAGSRDGVYPGIDVKGGDLTGASRGFAFLPPTIKISKTTGEPAAYWWLPGSIDLAGLADTTADTSGAALAARVRELKARSGAVAKVVGDGWYADWVRSSTAPQSETAARGAIDAKVAEVADYTGGPGGGFRTILIRAALTLGGYVGGGFLAESIARDLLGAAVRTAWGAEPDDEDGKWIDDGLADGAARPFRVISVAQKIAAPGGMAPVVRWSTYDAIGSHPFDPVGKANDQDLAEAVGERIYSVLRYCVDTGRWVVRSRECWAERPDMADWAVALLARLMPTGDSDKPGKGEDPTDAQFAYARRQKFMDSGGAGKIARKLIAVAKNPDHYMGIEVARLDSEPEVLWAGGVPWDLRASVDEPQIATYIDPNSPHLRSALCAPELVDTPVWDHFTETVWPDPEARAWALRVLSITLTGYADAALPILYGPKRTGKTSLITLLTRLLGSYGHAADRRLLTGAEGHASIIYALMGRRLSFIDEGPRRGNVATEHLKQLTGGGDLTGNPMRGDPITFEPTHTLVMTCNDPPPMTDEALAARVRLIACDSPESAVRPARKLLTPSTWAAEAPGVLAAMMAQAASWLEDPDSAGSHLAPESVRAMVEDLVREQDPVDDWVRAMTVPATPGTLASDLYRMFAAWHDGDPIHRKKGLPSTTTFGRRLTALGYEPKRYGRDKDRFIYRPLMVTGSNNMWPQFLQTGQTDSKPTEPSGEGLGSAVEGSGEQPSPRSTSSLPASSSSSSSSGESGESYKSITPSITVNPLCSSTHTHSNGVVTTENPGNRENVSSSPPTLPGAGADVPSDLRERSGGGSNQRSTVNDLGTRTGEPKNLPRAQNSATTAAPHDHAPTVTKPRKSGARLTDEEKARRKAVRDAQTAQRREERDAAKAVAKHEARVAAILAAAGGPELPFPISVPRGGLPVSVDLAAAQSIVRTAMARDGALTVDIEATGYQLGHRLHAVRTIQLGDALDCVIFDPADPAQRALAAALLAQAPAIRAFSATADACPLSHHWPDEFDHDLIWAKVWDVVIPSQLCLPTGTSQATGLKKRAGGALGELAVIPAADAARKALFSAGGWLTDTEADTEIGRNGWAQVPSGSPVMARYAAGDVHDTAALAMALPQVAPDLMDRERTAQRLVSRVTTVGLPINAAKVEELYAHHTAGWTTAHADVCAFGIDNPGSSAQVGKVLVGMGAVLPLTDGGKPSVERRNITKYQSAPGALGELVRYLLVFGKHQKALSTYVKPYRALCRHGDGRVRPTIYTMEAATGRMSSVRPNCQNIPGSGGFRAMIEADKDHLLCSADFSGVELRGAAGLSQDRHLMSIIAADDEAKRLDPKARSDIHWKIALQVYGEQATKAMRGRVKNGVVFPRIYGSGIDSIRDDLGITQDEVEAIVRAMDSMTPGYTAWAAQMRAMVRGGHVRFPTYTGRQIYLDRSFPHKASNYAIQGTARELLVDALVKWSRTRWAKCVLIPVHDELIVMVPAHEAKEALATLVECMETSFMGVPIIVEAAEPSPFWQDKE